DKRGPGAKFSVSIHSGIITALMSSWVVIPLWWASLLSRAKASASSDCMNLLDLDLSRNSLATAMSCHTIGCGKIRWTCRILHTRRVLHHVYTPVQIFNECPC